MTDRTIRAGGSEGTGSTVQPDDAMRLAETGPFGLIVSGSDDVIQTVNETMLRWLGRDRGEVEGRLTVPDLLAPGDRIYHETHIRPMLAVGDGVSEIAVQFVRADGTRLSALLSAIRHADPDRIEMVVVDATERRRYEKELLHERKLAEESQARLEMMYDVASRFAIATTIDEILVVATEQSETWVRGASCSVWLFSADFHRASRHGAGDGPGPAQLALEPSGSGLATLLEGDLIVIDGREDHESEFPLIHQQLQAAGRPAAMVAPLRVDGQLHGVLTYAFDVEHEFSADERQSVRSLATQAEQAIERVLSLDAERRSRNRLESAYGFAGELAEARTVDEVLAAMEAAGNDLDGAVSSSVAVLDEDRAAIRAMTPDPSTPNLIPLSNPSLAGEAIRRGELVSVESGAELRDRHPDTSILAEGDVGSVVAVPLSNGDEILGAWTVAYRQAGPPDEDDLMLLRHLAGKASRAISRAVRDEAESAALTRSDLQLGISELLNAAMTADDVASAIMTGGRNAFDASYLAAYLPEQVGATTIMRRIAHVGPEDRIADLDPTLASTIGLVREAGESLAPTYAIGSEHSLLAETPFSTLEWAWSVFLPLSISGTLDGLIVIGFDSLDSLTSATRTALAGLAAEASTAFARARRFDVEHDVATTLQRSLLQPELPSVPGWIVSAGYSPGSEHLEVGGDLFDVTVAPDGTLVVVVGDVVGHGLGAAAAMGALRSAARALTLVSAGPGEVIDGLNRFAATTPGVKGATVACVWLGPDGRGRYACAGHPFPVVCRADGSTELLEKGRSPVLGIRESAVAGSELQLGPGDGLVLYTDGLVERRGASIDTGIDNLRSHLTLVQKSHGAVAADEVIAEMLRDSPADDDTVVVCLSRAAPPARR